VSSELADRSESPITAPGLLWTRSWRRRAVQFPTVAKRVVAANGAAAPQNTADTKMALSKRYHDTPCEAPLNRLRQNGAVSANLAKCAQIADPEVARFGKSSPTRRLKAQQAKIPHEKSKGLRAGSNPSKRGLIIRGMLTSPDRPSRGLVLRSVDAKESTMIYIRHLAPRQAILKSTLMSHSFERTP
jgi:hypothetical protein